MPQQPSFPSIPPSKEQLLEELTRAAVNLWGRQRANVLSEILDEHARQLFDLSLITPPSVEAPTLGRQNHP